MFLQPRNKQFQQDDDQANMPGQPIGGSDLPGNNTPTPSMPQQPGLVSRPPIISTNGGRPFMATDPITRESTPIPSQYQPYYQEALNATLPDPAKKQPLTPMVTPDSVPPSIEMAQLKRANMPLAGRSNASSLPSVRDQAIQFASAGSFLQPRAAPIVDNAPDYSLPNDMQATRSQPILQQRFVTSPPNMPVANTSSLPDMQSIQQQSFLPPRFVTQPPNAVSAPTALPSTADMRQQAVANAFTSEPRTPDNYAPTNDLRAAIAGAGPQFSNPNAILQPRTAPDASQQQQQPTPGVPLAQTSPTNTESGIQPPPPQPGNGRQYVYGDDATFSPPTGLGQYDPYAMARQQLGPQHRRGVGGVLRDLALGLATGGIGGAIAEGIAGGDLRYRNQVNQRAAQLQQAIQNEHQVRADDLNNFYKNALIKDRFDKTNIANREEDRKTNADQQKYAIQNGRLEETHLAHLNGIARTLKGTKTALPDDVAAEMGLPQGTVLENDPKNPNKYSLLHMRDGRVLRLDKVGGGLEDTGYEDQPVSQSKPPSEHELRQQAHDDLYDQYSQKYPNGAPNPEYQQKAAGIAKSRNLQPGDPQIDQIMARRYPHVSKTVDIEDSQEFKTAVANEAKRRRGAGTVPTNPPTPTNNNPQPGPQPKQPTPKQTGQQTGGGLDSDMQVIASHIKSNPGDAAAILQEVSKDYPGVDVRAELNKRFPGLVK